MAFEKFTGSGRTYKPTVSIWKRGQIGFNQGAVQRFRLKECRYVVLYYDKDTRRIGFEFTENKDEEGAISITFGQTGGFVSAKSFLEYYEIDYGETKKYDIARDEGSGLHVIQLQEDTV